MARERKPLDVTDFILEYAPDIFNLMSSPAYDAAVLTKHGYSIKNGKVFDHIGRKIADSMDEAFRELGQYPQVLKPARIYLTDDLEDVGEKDTVRRVGDLFFYADTMYADDGEIT